MVKAQPIDPDYPVPSWEDVENFCDAAEAGNDARVLAYLDRFGANILDEKNSRGAPAIVLAADTKRFSTMTLLLDEGADIETRNMNGQSALISTYNMSVKVSSFLLDRGADVDVADTQGNSALIYAAIMGNVEVAKLFIERGADLNAQNSRGWTALMSAVRCGNPFIVKLLLEAGAKTDIRDNKGYRAEDRDDVAGNDMNKHCREMIPAWQVEIDAAYQDRLDRARNLHPKSVFKRKG